LPCLFVEKLQKYFNIKQEYEGGWN